jgi:hypothetical protein
MRFVYFGFGAAFVLVVGLVVFAMLPDASEWRVVVEGEGAWHVTVSKNGGFECLFPSKPERLARKHSEAWIWKDAIHDLRAVVFWVPLAPGDDLEDRREVENLLEKYAKLFKWEADDVRVVSARNFQLADGSFARETVFHSPKSGYRRSRIILRHGRVYEIGMAGSQDFVEGKDAETFFGAFRFLDGTSASERKIALFPAGSRVDAEVRTVAHTEARTAEVERGFPMVSKASGIACTFPSAPKGERLEDGETYTWTAEGGGRTLEIMSKRSELFDPQNDEQMKRVFADFQRTFQKGFEWSRVISSSDFLFAPDVACHDFLLEIPDSRRFRMRVLLTRDRAHMVTALGPEEFVLGDETGAFFESVRILDEGRSDGKAGSPPGESRTEATGGYAMGSKAGGIIFTFPSKPEISDLGNGESYSWMAAGGDRHLQIIWKKTPEPFDPQNGKQMRTAFAECQKAFAGKFEWTREISSRDFVFAPDVVCRDFVLEIPDSQRFRMRVLLVRDRAYMVLARGPEEFVMGEEAGMFFEAVRFLDGATADDGKVVSPPVP